MNNQYKVSIIVPTYNVKEYLSECMESILAQSLKDIQIICVDDGSTDGSGEILDKYQKKDKRVEVFHNTNGGYGKAMNFGLSKAKGKYIGIVEPDDYILPDMFEKLYITANEKGVELVKSNFKRFYGSKEDRWFEEIPITEKKGFYNRVIDPAKEAKILFFTMNIWTGIYDRKFIEENDIRFNETPGASFQDNGFWFQTMTKAKRVYFLDDYFYMNRRDNPNSSVKGTEKAFCIMEEFNFIESFLNRNQDIRDNYINYFVKCKLVGYVAAYNRSSKSHKIQFILKASEDLKRHWEAGEIDKSLFGPIQWKKLNTIISDPVKYFIDDMSEKKKDDSKNLAEIYGRIAQARNKLVKIEKACNNTIIHVNNSELEDVKVTVIVPAYNVREYIDCCLESIVGQTLKEIEIICVDDGSTDDTFDKLLNWAKSDDRIKIISQANMGSGYARNQALKIALGEYVMFMDADDWYPSDNVIEKLYTTVKEHNVLIAGGGIKAYKGTEECEPLDYYNFTEDGKVEYCDYQLDYGYTRYIYNLKLILDNDLFFPDYTRFQDPVFFVKVMSKAQRFYAITDVVYAYRKTNKKKKFNGKQCRDILLAIKELEQLCVQKNYETIKANLDKRITEEFFDYYAFYLCSNEPGVCNAFASLFVMLNDETKILLMNKLAYYVSTKFVIPLKKAAAKNEDIYALKEGQNIKTDIEKLKKELDRANSEWKQARFEVDSIRASISYKAGLFITYIPRKIRRLLKGKNT